MSVSRSLGLKLFLEGQEVDVASADLSCGVNQPATCDLEIPTSDSAHRLLPRTLVHLFYYDSSYSTGALPRHPEEVVTGEGQEAVTAAKKPGPLQMTVPFGLTL